ncbi:MAG: C40 family peptidase, partial [Actinomycetota bacterium]|nr:C40 family peptidase [Actinomycetota bacterium]
GYPGWVRASHLTDPVGPSPRAPLPTAGPGTTHGHPLVALARQHLDLPYLWGGLSPHGLDCSGLVHWCYRELGVVVPRDADDQQDACRDVPLEQVQSGDLYFFRYPGAAGAHHVGIVTGPGSMIHAPETGQGIMHGPLDPGRLATFAGAGRLPLS